MEMFYEFNKLDFGFNNDNQLLRQLNLFFNKMKGEDFDINSKEIYIKDYPLHRCINNLNVKSFIFLVEAGMDLNKKDLNGNSPLMMVADNIRKDFMDISYKENITILKSILEDNSKIDFKIRNKFGSNVFAIMGESKEINDLINNSAEIKNQYDINKNIELNLLRKEKSLSELTESLSLNLDNDFTFL